MNASEHYAKAEIALDAAASIQGDSLGYTASEALLDAIAHALLAIGSELGIPPQPHPVMAQLAKQRAQAAADAQRQWSQAVAGGQP